MKVSFVLLAHESPSKLKELIEVILQTGSDIFVHYDLNAKSDLEYDSKQWGLEKLSGNLYFADRVSVAWGEWSIVQGTLNCMRLARSIGYQCDYMMLISGSCMPIKPIDILYRYLQYADKDYIEAVNADENIWVKGGIQNERWTKYHFFNYRTSLKKFRISRSIQDIFGINRSLPLQHKPYIGSQWWTLRVSTVETILKLLDQHPSIEKFYKYTCVPDEHFFQTLIANAIPFEQISKESLTSYSFNSFGVPRVYYDDDYIELLYDPKLFARKISNNAKALKSNLFKLSGISSVEFEKYCVDRFSSHRRSLKTLHSRKIGPLKNEWINPCGQKINYFEFLRSIPNRIVVAINFTSSTSTSDSFYKEVNNDHDEVFLDFSCFNQSGNQSEEEFFEAFIKGPVAAAAVKNIKSDIYILANPDDLSLIAMIRWSCTVSVVVFYDNTKDLQSIDIQKIRALVEGSYCNYNETYIGSKSSDSVSEIDYKEEFYGQRPSLPEVDIVIAPDFDSLSILRSKYGGCDQVVNELSELITVDKRPAIKKVFLLELSVSEISRLRKYYSINIIFYCDLLFDIDDCDNTEFYLRTKKHIQFYKKYLCYKKKFSHLAATKFEDA